MTNPKSLFAHDFSSSLSQLELTDDAASAAVSKLIGSAPRPHDAAGLTHVCTDAHASVTAVIEFLQDANPTAFDIALSVSALKERILALTEDCSPWDHIASDRLAGGSLRERDHEVRKPQQGHAEEVLQ